MEQTIKVLHLDSNHATLMAKLEASGIQNHTDYISPKEIIESKIGDYEGIVIRSRFPIDRSFLDKAVKLKFIARVGAGLESIDTAYAESKGIRLIAAPEGNRNAVAEQTLGMLLSLFNNLKRADREVAAGQWNREANRGYELDGKTVGIIGYGNMGKAFAKKLRGFDVEVLFHDIREGLADTHARQVTLAELQEKADVLSLHIPWTPETDKMVDAAFINAFAKPFWLVNTSRGKNVVTADLVEALRSGKVRGAALDVLEYERSSFETLFTDERPEPLVYLTKADNVLLSPHIAGWTYESHEKLASVIADKIIALYHPEETPEKEIRVTGIGGFFFKAKDAKALSAWYNQHLGIDAGDYGWAFTWKDHDGNDGLTNWAAFSDTTRYFEPSEKQFMQNFRVHDLDGLMGKLRSEGVTIVGTPESYDYGKFAWILDPEGNKIELWEPIDSALS